MCLLFGIKFTYLRVASDTAKCIVGGFIPLLRRKRDLDSAGFAPAAFSYFGKAFYKSSLRTKRATAAPRALYTHSCVLKGFKPAFPYNFGVTMAYLGYILISLGILIILFTFLIGYGLYEQANSKANAPYSQPAQNATVGGILGPLTSDLSSTINTGTYLSVEVIVLFLFASIGYKIAMIGVQINREGGKTNGGK